MAANNGNLVYRTFYDNSGPNLYCVFKVLRYLYLCTGYTRYIFIQICPKPEIQTKLTSFHFGVDTFAKILSKEIRKQKRI